MRIPSKHNPQVTKDVYKELRRQDTEKELQHTRSGKLSAGKLGHPLLEQVLYVLGVPPKPHEDYTLGVFRRGNSVERDALELLSPDETQVEVFYRGTIGIIDAIRNGMVYEVKSIKNSQVGYIDPSNTTMRYDVVDGVRTKVPVYQGVKYANALQATQNGLARGDEFVTVLYVAADDYRTFAHVIRVSDVKPEVDRIIDQFENQMKSGVLPLWKEREAYQAKYPQYSMYPDWINIDVSTAMQKLEAQYPDAYRKLKGK